jgi:hypothetical protein
MIGDLAPLPLTSDVQAAFFGHFTDLILHGSQPPPDMLREPLLAFVNAAARVCTYQPELPVVDALLRDIPGEWFDGFLQFLLTDDPRDNCALFRTLLAISGHPSCHPDVHYDLLTSFTENVVGSLPPDFVFWPDAAIRDLFAGIRALRGYADLVRACCCSIADALPAVIDCIWPESDSPVVDNPLPMVKSWLRLMTVFESRDEEEDWEAEFTGAPDDHPIDIQRSIILESLLGDRDRVPPVFGTILRSLEDGDFEMKALAITFLPELLREFASFAQANFEQLFVGLCEVASAIRDEDGPHFDDIVIDIFFEVWSSFLTNLTSLAAQMEQGFMHKDEIAQLCRSVPPIRDLLNPDYSDDPVEAWTLALYFGVDDDELCEAHLEPDDDEPSDPDAPAGSAADIEESNLEGALLTAALALVQRSPSPDDVPPAPPVARPVCPLLECEDRDKRIVHSIVCVLMRHRSAVEIGEDELTLYIWLDLQEAFRKDMLNPDRDQIIDHRVALWLEWVQNGGDRPIGPVALASEDQETNQK